MIYPHRIYSYIVGAFLLCLLSSVAQSASAPYLSIYPKPGGTIRVVDSTRLDSIIVGRVRAIIAAKGTTLDVMLFPSETKPKSAGIYTDIPTASPLWKQIGDPGTKWRLQKGFEGWANNSEIITLNGTPSPSSEIIATADLESISAQKRSTAVIAKGAKQISGRLSVILRGYERLVQAKGKDLFMQLCVDGRMVSTSNNLTSPLVWSSDNLPDGCYLVEIRAYTDGMNRLLFASTQTVCVRNEL